MPVPPIVIGITMGHRDLGPAPTPNGRVRPRRPEVVLKAALVEAVQATGAVAVLLPPLSKGANANQTVDRLLTRLDGVVLAGGAFDIHPRHYGQQVEGRLDAPDEGRTGLELSLARRLLHSSTPVLGICGGLQALAVAAGGTLHQHIPDAFPGAIDHEQATDPATPAHLVKAEAGLLQDALGENILVNSTHHQAIDTPGALRIVGWAEDGVVEAAEGPGRWCVGVQWHPELLAHDALFKSFFAACCTR